MNKITSYIIRQVSFATLFIGTILTCAIWLTQSMRFIDIIVNKGLAFSTFTTLVVYLLPDLIGIVLPVALLIGVVFVYNRLIADNELIVLRAIGLDDWQLAKPALTIAAIVTVILYCISLYFTPMSFKKLRDLEHELRHTISTSMLHEGQFVTLKNMTVFIRKNSSPTLVSGILIYDARDPEKPFTITAEKGSFLKTKTGDRLILVNGIRHETNKSGQPSSLYFDQHIIDLTTKDQALPERGRKPHEYFINELFNPPSPYDFPKAIAKFRTRAHQTLLGPLHAIAFALIAITALLWGDYNRRGRSKRLIVVVLAVCFTQALTLSFLNLSEQVTFALPIPYVILFGIIFFCIGYLREWVKPDNHFSPQRGRAE